MQMISLLRKLLAPRSVAGELAADGNDRAGVTLIHHDGATLFARHLNRCAIVGSPKNHWFRKCDVVEKLRSETCAHEKFMLLLEAHHHQQSIRTRQHFRCFLWRFEADVNSFGFGNL